jgi:hypothetical protein
MYQGEFLPILPARAVIYPRQSTLNNGVEVGVYPANIAYTFCSSFYKSSIFLYF